MSLLVGDVIVMNVVFKIKIGLDLLKYYKGLLKGILPTFLIAVIAGEVFSMIGLSGWFGFVCNVAVYCVFFGIVAVKIGMNSNEKRMVSGVVLSIKYKVLKAKK